MSTPEREYVRVISYHNFVLDPPIQAAPDSRSHMANRRDRARTIAGTEFEQTSQQLLRFVGRVSIVRISPGSKNKEKTGLKSFWVFSAVFSSLKGCFHFCRRRHRDSRFPISSIINHHPMEGPVTGKLHARTLNQSRMSSFNSQHAPWSSMLCLIRSPGQITRGRPGSGCNRGKLVLALDRPSVIYVYRSSPQTQRILFGGGEGWEGLFGLNFTIKFVLIGVPKRH